MPKIPTCNDWSKTNESSYSMLLSYIKTKIDNLDEFTFITDHKRAIMSLVEAHPSWALTTIENVLFMIAKFLKLKNEKRYAKLYSQRAYEIMQGNREKESHNSKMRKKLKTIETESFLSIY